MAIARGQAPAPPIPITAYQLDLLRELFRKHSTSQQTAERIHILLLAYEGYSNSHVSRVLNISLNTVKKWRTRWLMDYENLVKFESQVVTEKISLLTFQKRLLSVIKDKPRSGTPKKITLSQEQKIIALSCDKPIVHNIEMTDWTYEMLAKVAVSKNIVSSISSSQVGRILKNKPTPTSKI